MDLISIVMPVYNVEKYLSKCFDSVLAQTYQNFEIICVNDGSSDNSESILKEYASKDKRIRYVNKTNGGASSARNFGLPYVKGKFCCFLDSDDYIHPQFLEILLENIKDVDACCCDYLCVDGDIEMGKLKPYDVKRMDSLEYFSVAKDLDLAPWGKLYRTDILKKFSFDENCYFSEDVLFHANLFRDNLTLNIISAPLLYYRYNPNSIVHRKSDPKKIISLLEVGAYISKKFTGVHKDLWNKIYKNRIAKSVSNALKYYEDCGNDSQIQHLIKNLYKQKIIHFKGLSLRKKIALFKILFSKEK